MPPALVASFLRPSRLTCAPVPAAWPRRPFKGVHSGRAAEPTSPSQAQTRLDNLRYLHTRGVDVGDKATWLELAVYLRGETAVLPTLQFRIRHGTLSLADAQALLWDIATVPAPDFVADNEDNIKELVRDILRRVHN